MPGIEGEGFPKQSLGCGGVLTYSPNKGGATEVGFLLIPKQKEARLRGGSYLSSIEVPLYIRISRRRLGT